MSLLESLIATGGEAPLLDSLSFDLPPASTAVVDRKQGLRAYPTSASTLSPGQTKTCRIRLGGNDFVNPESVRLQFTVTNLDTALAIYPVAGPWGAWAQVRLISGGVELDNIPAYNRHHDLHGYELMGFNEQWNEGIYGFGGSWNNQPNIIHTDTTHAHLDSAINPRPVNGVIAPNGASITVSHKLLLSLFTAGKMIPVRYAPLELELTLGDRLDFALTGGSTNYSISNIQLIYDASVLDEAVQESFYKALLSNHVLNIPCQNFYQVVQTIPAGSTSFSFTVVRAFSRLSHVWITFRKTGARTNEFIYPGPLAVDETDEGENPVFTADDALTVRLSCGPKNWPDYAPVSTIQEHFMMLQKCLPHAPNMDRGLFTGNLFTSCFDLRRTPGDPSSALSTRSGDLLRCEFKNMLANSANECWVSLWSFGVCAVRESGVTLLD